MKAIIKIFIMFFLIVVSSACISSCKRKENPSYTVKGYLFYGENKVPFKNEQLEFLVYRKKKPFEQSPREHIFDRVIGSAKSDDNGYIEFTYEHQSTGVYIMMQHAITATFENEEHRIPLNTNVEREFYRPPHGWASIFLNTNGKLNDEDTFFISHRKFLISNDFEIDTVLGNFNGFVKTIKVPNSEIRITAGKGEKGLRGEPGFWFPDISLERIPITGHPNIDSIYIEY